MPATHAATFPHESHQHESVDQPVLPSRNHRMTSYCCSTLPCCVQLLEKVKWFCVHFWLMEKGSNPTSPTHKTTITSDDMTTTGDNHNNGEERILPAMVHLARKPFEAGVHALLRVGPVQVDGNTRLRRGPEHLSKLLLRLRTKGKDIIRWPLVA